ncbi:hypothetical protein HMPREF1317_1123 [Schaalia georgiae F0490]|uniref:Uncharacterized protein n=1 Tax=Schaalia georgiae F0490 TaxID=1125717 RepID=J0XRQ9_9ACTO|nr:hypothetical protein HMPREF1317_1123 [Schaalia georgiae F0490]
MLEAERLLHGRGGALAPILGTDDPATELREASLKVQRQIIDPQATATLCAQ